MQPEAIGETLDLVRGALDPWLGTPKRTLKEGRVNLVYRFTSEDNPPLQMRLKIEINSRVDALLRPGLTWDFDEALQLVLDHLISKLPGQAWNRGS